MNGLGARIAFGWMGAELGGTIGTGAGPYGTAIGAVLGGLAGLFGGEALIKGIEEAANRLTGIVSSNGNSVSEAKAPEAMTNADGSTTIAAFNPDKNKPAIIKTFDREGRLTGETRFDYDPLTDIKTRETDLDGSGVVQSEKHYNRETGKLSLT